MKKHRMKIRVAGLYAMISAGMLLLTGCAGADPEVKTVTESEAEAGSETETEPKTEASEVGREHDSAGHSGTAADHFTDANDMFTSADVSGMAVECSAAGFTINTSPFADGSGAQVTEEESMKKVVYADGVIFQKGIVASDGSSYSLEDGEKSAVADSDFVLCFGKQQADGAYLADRIIMIDF